MNKISFCLFIFIFSVNCFSVQAQTENHQSATNQTQNSDAFYHTIERGQTVYAIATMYGIAVDDIYRLNPESKNGIKIGLTLKIPQKKKSQLVNNSGNDYTFHTIGAGETLYSVSHRYNIPADAIIKANPGLSSSTFTIGKIIRLPRQQAEEEIIEQIKTVYRDTEYTVKKKDTFYSICRRFDTTKEQLIKRNPSLKKGIKEGAQIYIPEKFEEVTHSAPEAPQEGEINALLNSPKTIKQIKEVKAVLLLPFTDESEALSRTPLYVEYYEGLLLAIANLKNSGYSINLTVYDTGSGTKKMKDILKKEAMKEANLIIGGVQNDQISLLANFSHKNNIKYVIPFTSKNDDVLSNADIFQVNTPHSYLYAKAAQAACDLFKNHNVILLNFSNDPDQKTDFIKTLKMEMKQQHLALKEVDYTGNFAAEIESMLSKDKPNVIIPSSGSASILTQILSPLRMLAETKPEYGLSLFGYPEWQTYTKDCLEDFHALNTYIYSNFYADNLSPEIKNFYQLYKTWFSKSLINTYPKYGMLGYDTGLYFLNAIRDYGEDFENHLSKIKSNTIQTGFNFERVNNWGGLINTNLFIIHYKNDFTVTKSELNRP